MIIYFILFIIVYFLGIAWEKNKNNKFSYIFPITIALIISLFAGLRNDSVGTDVNVYAKPVLEITYNYGIETLIKSNSVEILYILLAYLVTWIKGDLGVFLFFSQLIPIFFYLLFLNKEKNNLSLSTGVLAYVTVFMGISLNIMRQAIAMGITIFSYTYIKKRNLKKFILTIFIATNFHVTALIFLPLYFIYGLKNKKFDYLAKLLIISIFIIMIVFFDNLFTLAINIGLLPSKYNLFMTVFYNEKLNIQFRAFIFRIFLFLLCYYFLSKNKYNNVQEASFFKFLLIIDMILYLLGIKIANAERISYYYSFLIYLYVIPRGIIVEKNNVALKLGINLILMLYFILMYVILGFGEIVPYTSIILGI